jgi:hypothetical protein
MGISTRFCNTCLYEKTMSRLATFLSDQISDALR